MLYLFYLIILKLNETDSVTIPKINPEMPNGKKRIFNVLRLNTVIAQVVPPILSQIDYSCNNLNKSLIDENMIINNQENKVSGKNDVIDEVIKPIPVILQPNESLVKSVMEKINNFQSNQILEESILSEKNENIKVMNPIKDQIKVESIFEDHEVFKIPYFLTREWVVKNFNLKK